MPNPTINFRIHPYQLARGLQIVRSLEPNYQLLSVSQLVKTIYYDYLAKMSIGRNDNVNQAFVDEINLFIKAPKTKQITLSDIVQKENESNFDMPDNSEAEISTVSDFSPPTEWQE